MWYVCDVLYVHVSCFIVRGCDVSRMYIDVCHNDVFSVVNVYLKHLKLCVVCINGRRSVVVNEMSFLMSKMSPPQTLLCTFVGVFTLEVSLLS